MRRILTEPLVHFLAIGAVLFGLYVVVNPQDALSNKSIVIDKGRIGNIIATFERTWNRKPSDAELKGLVDNFIVEEVLYRKALALGMDKDDPMIRRRLRQKMEFATVDAASMIDYSDDDLARYLEQHSDKFRADARYTFEQVYISPDRPDAEIERRLEDVGQALARGEPMPGDQSLLPGRFDHAAAFEVNRSLGADFSNKLDGLALNVWSEPLRSGLGYHFVRMEAMQPGRVPALAEIRSVVEREWLNEKNNELREKLTAGLLANYNIVVEWPDS